jgi:hypothetical protein
LTERLAPLVAPWARRTQRLTPWRVHSAVALAGTAGARLSCGLGRAGSRNPLVRLLRRLPLPHMATPQVLGIDDWAVRTGQTSGTIVIDRERHRPLALLPDREAKTVALWVQAQPGVRVISRDRSKASADGARPGAPDALQVADRVHLRHNLAEALDHVFTTHHHALQAVQEARHQAPVTQPDGTVAVPVPPPSPPSRAQTLAHPRRAQRRALAQEIWAVHRQGWPGPAIATLRGSGQNTGCRSRRTTTFPERTSRSDRGRRLLTPDTPSLLERGNAGGRDALRLCRERQQRGDPGSDVTVARDAPRLR